MNRFIKTLSTLFIITLIPLTSFSATTVDKIVAVINDETITLSELIEEEKKINSGKKDKIEQRLILEKIIEKKILDQEATKRGLSVTDEELKLALNEIMGEIDFTDEKFQSELKKKNLTTEEFKQQWKYQILSRKLMNTQLRGKIAISEDEILKYYKENYGAVEYTYQVRIAHILIPIDEENSLEKSNEIFNSAKSGNNFSDLAKKHSKDSSSAANGGDIGYFNKGDLIPVLEEAIETTEVGGITGPVKTTAGFHIIKVLDRKDSKTASLEGYREEIKQAIYNQKFQDYVQNWISKLKESAYIEIKI